LVNLLALKFGTDVVNIGMVLQKKFMKKNQFLSPREGVKVGSKLAAMKKIRNFMVPDCTTVSLKIRWNDSHMPFSKPPLKGLTYIAICSDVQICHELTPKCRWRRKHVNEYRMMYMKRLLKSI